MDGEKGKRASGVCQRFDSPSAPECNAPKTVWPVRATVRIAAKEPLSVCVACPTRHKVSGHRPEPSRPRDSLLQACLRSAYPPTSRCRRLTWAKDDCVPDHEVVRARSARDTAGRVALEPLKVAHCERRSSSSALYSVYHAHLSVRGAGAALREATSAIEG